MAFTQISTAGVVAKILLSFTHKMQVWSIHVACLSHQHYFTLHAGLVTLALQTKYLRRKETLTDHGACGVF
jgi:hypothetical protein